MTKEEHLIHQVISNQYSEFLQITIEYNRLLFLLGGGFLEWRSSGAIDREILNTSLEYISSL